MMAQVFWKAGSGDWTSENWTGTTTYPEAGDQAVINAAGGPYTVTISSAVAANTVTVNANATLDDTGSLTLSGPGAALIVAAGEAYVTGSVIGGAISVGSGATLAMGAAASNTGTISIAGGGNLDLYGALSIPHAVSFVSDARINLHGSETTAQLEGFVGSYIVRVRIYGALDNRGSNLVIGSGAAIPALTLQTGGVIAGGVVTNSGSNMAFASGALNGVTWHGLMDLSPAGSRLTIMNGLTVTGANGTGPGLINMTGAGSYIWFQGAQTFDNATINMGSFYRNGNDDLQAPDPTDLGGQILTLGSNATIQMTGPIQLIGTLDSNGKAGVGDDGIVNKGSIVDNASFLEEQALNFTNNGQVVVGADDEIIPSYNFTNSGSLILGQGAIADIDIITDGGFNFTNLSGTVLTGGTYDIGDGARLLLSQEATITVLDADLILREGGEILGVSNGSYFDNTLTEIGATGVLQLYDHEMKANGGLLTIDAGGVLTGSGLLACALVDNGQMVADGGKLTISGAVTGTGRADIGETTGHVAATLELGAASSIGVTFNNLATLILDLPSAHSGTLSGFAVGDTLQLQGVTASQAASNVDGTQLIVTTSVGQLVFKLSGADYASDSFVVHNTGTAAQITLSHPPQTLSAQAILFGQFIAADGHASNDASGAVNLAAVPARQSVLATAAV